MYINIFIYLSGFLCNINRVISYDSGGLVEGCCENELAFGCKEEGTVVVIKEAFIHDRWYKVEDRSCHIPEYKIEYKRGSVLQHINKKCAMSRSCRFRVLADVPGAKEEEENWKGHVLRVDYECVQENSFYRTCGEKIDAQKGFIQNVGYPKYYLGPGACTFTLLVDSGQRVKLQLYDVSIRGIYHTTDDPRSMSVIHSKKFLYVKRDYHKPKNYIYVKREIVRPTEQECRDFVAVSEGSTELLRKCGNPKKPLAVISTDNFLNITLHTSSDVYLKRGFVAGFSAVGCKTPLLPEDGYMSHRNATHAEFWCCVRHVFPDTMQRVKYLTCRYDMQWDKVVPDCVDLDDLLINGNITEDDYLRLNGSAGKFYFLTKKEVVYDVILPGFIMTVLIVGNVGVLFLIILCRRKIREDNENLEELESIKANAEPTDVSEPCLV